ncbi:hypothetical protein [Planctomycetes bacterium TBK1r]|uniref:Zinc ribbon domain-containing protein n=1 Tax=Stieleria magnilauensis TaxID=2527963 RepID=A0ABX5Y0E7_9BACT|nr:hypothetical protein TBK1r_62440 [Planctomycetes bacterium TBK1r]
MLWELYQQSKIRDAGATATRAESKSNNMSYEVARLEDKIESLALTCQALWEVARDHSGLSDEELLAKVSEIDLRDGVADGKMGSGTGSCSKCGRTISKRRMSCMYCGEQIVKQHTFQP